MQDPTGAPAFEGIDLRSVFQVLCELSGEPVRLVLIEKPIGTYSLLEQK
jgi:hypothetical protein